MTEQLTPDDLKLLRAKFPLSDHEWLRDFVYITEAAITTRIEDVDPAWRFEIISIFNSGNHVVVTARMTIKGVSRDGVGMQIVNEKAGEAEKGAATDAMKRCARLFGVGRYLLDAPGKAQFATWLNGNAQPQEPRRLVNNPLSETAKNKPRPAGDWQEVVKIKMVKGVSPDLPAYKLNLANGKTALADNPSRLERAGFSLMSIEKLDTVYDIDKGLYITVKNADGTPIVGDVWVEPSAA